MITALLFVLLASPAAPPKGYPADADVETLSEEGEAVGALDRLRVRSKYTVFDIYAEWCGPCHAVDRHLQSIVRSRRDVAVRRLNVMEFASPLGKELSREFGDEFDGLPFLVIFAPDGRRSEVLGLDTDAIDDALARER